MLQPVHNEEEEETNIEGEKNRLRLMCFNAQNTQYSINWSLNSLNIMNHTY